MKYDLGMFLMLWSKYQKMENISVKCSIAVHKESYCRMKDIDGLDCCFALLLESKHQVQSTGRSICETWSDSRACLWMRMKSRGSFLAHGGRFTWFTRSLFCRTPKSKPARGESGKYHANIRRGKMCSNNSILMFYMNMNIIAYILKI